VERVFEELIHHLSLFPIQITHIFQMGLSVFACLVSLDGHSFRVFAVVKVMNEKSFVVTGIRDGRQGNCGSSLAEAGIL
jgi:hypothetical protein